MQLKINIVQGITIVQGVSTLDENNILFDLFFNK